MSQKPKIVDLKMLDTDFAQLAEANPVSAYRKMVFGPDCYNVEYIQQQVRWYQCATTQNERDNLLCRIAGSGELFTPADMEAIDDRTRENGIFSLLAAERKQVIDWLKDQLEIDLNVADDQLQ